MISEEHLQTQLRGWRHHLHAHPELGYEEQATSAFVAEQLDALGIEVHRGLGKTGVVGVLRGEGSANGASVGLRADMDALPIEERSALAYASRTPGIMHACGHDGHTTMLLGAAQLLAEDRDFSGTVIFIFQPAEEGLAGARAMIEDGLFERFPCDMLFALHNWPDLQPGQVLIRSGPMMASADSFDIRVCGKGGHAGLPHRAVDPVVVASQLITGIQTLVSRTINPASAGLISVTQLEAGTTYNVIPDEVVLKGTLRAVSPDVRDQLEQGLRTIVETLPRAFGSTASIDYHPGYPPTINHATATATAREAALQVFAEETIRDDLLPSMGAEDFAFMLEACPGAYLWIGQGGAPLHSSVYDFNDSILVDGAKLFVSLAKTALAAKP